MPTDTRIPLVAPLLLSAVTLTACASAETNRDDATAGATEGTPATTTGSGTGHSGATGATATTTDGSGTSAATADTGDTSADGAATGVEAGDSATTGSSTTGALDSTTGDTGDTGGTTGAMNDPTHCWDDDVQTWTVTAWGDTMLTGENPVDAHITPDGLTLYYIAGPMGDRRPYKATRATRALEFSGGALDVTWTMPAVVSYPRAVGDELFLSVMNDVAVSTLNAGEWTAPVTYSGAVNTVSNWENFISVNADATRLLVQRNDGPMNMGLGGNVWRFYEAERLPGSSPGSEFVDVREVDIPNLADDDANLCPTISPDGLHLFFGSSSGEVIDDVNKPEVLDMWYTQRASVDRDMVDGRWQDAVELPVFDSSTLETCPSAVTEDGCSLVFHRFELGAPNYTIHIATRTP